MDWRYGGSKCAALNSFILNIKKDLDYLSFTSQCYNNTEELWSSFQLFTSLFPAFPRGARGDFMSVLPQITYGNMALIFLSYFHGYNKNEIFVDYWDTLNVLNVATFSVMNRSISSTKKIFYLIF
jgi:hypothetical protein